MKLNLFPSRATGGRRWAGPMLLAGLVVGLLSSAVPAAPPDWDGPQREASYVGDETCAGCHTEIADSLAMTPHGAIQAFQAPQGQTGCESCHGPGSRHAESNAAADIMNPGSADAALAAKACLQCHRNDHLDGFELSMHASSEVSCSGCHRVHGAPTRGLLRAADPQLCWGCHQEMRSRTALPSHHPIREGKMACADCHDPHRDEYRTGVAGETANDLCFKCHSAQQGPFIYEHTPVVEDCSLCHDPHGTVANNLLVQNEPFLCLQCHQAHFHSTLQGIEGDFVTLDGNTGTSHRDSAKLSMLTKCTQCHSHIHGSDLPSQSISGQGGSLTR